MSMLQAIFAGRVSPPALVSSHTAWSLFTAYDWGIGGWVHGAPLISSDVGGNGNLFFPIYDDSASKLDIAVSTNRGVSWSVVTPSAFNPGGAPVSMAQDSTGAVHLLCAVGNARWRYSRLTLTRTSGDITGFSVAQSAFDIGPSSPVLQGDTRGTIRVIYDQGGTECLAWIGSDQPLGTSDARVALQKTATITPSSASSFTMLDGSAGFETIWTDTINPHEFCPHLVQIPSTRAMWVVWGHIMAEGFNSNSTHAWRRRKLTPNGASTWSIGAWTVETASTHVQNVVASNDRVWIYRNHVTEGTHISTISASDVLTVDAVPSPTQGRVLGVRTGSMSVSPDGSRVALAWQNWSTFSSGDSESVKAVLLNGTWTHYVDATHDGTFGDAWGILASQGGQAADDTFAFVRVGTDAYSRAPWVSTIRVDPA